MDLRAVLKSQYHAALITLKQTIDRCPDDLWLGGDHENPVWRIAYHALFFTHLYLQPDEKAFRPWEHARPEYQVFGATPWPPHQAPKIGEPYSKAQILEYWGVCDAMIDEGVDRLDLDAPECGFPWYEMGKLEHQLVNIRHIQHHAAQIADRVCLRTRHAVDWIGGAEYSPGA